MLLYDIIIIGAGPAGASAGIFAGRAKKKVLILDNDKSGTKKAWVENHYAVMGITGYDVFETGKKQAEKAGAEIKLTEATQITKNETSFSVETNDGATYEANYIILATGASKKLANQLGVNMKPISDESKVTIIDADQDGKTNIEGVWAAGIVTGKSMHVAVTAGDGAKVAIHLLTEVNGKEYVDQDMMC
ncbi:FAD-dependent oxidoreductase [Longirhabdus pacifica]|uniref:FAD-dependent oxidoreductase n=1 Tax=Longirhabdus pacifica TaxID=2305227 RepID=UPI001009339C|nr:FAD-dependent oxidoreductase [Longirhabdus pacifica]